MSAAGLIETDTVLQPIGFSIFSRMKVSKTKSKVTFILVSSQKKKSEAIDLVTSCTKPPTSTCP